MVTVTGGEYIVISAQPVKPHSEVFHVSALDVHSTQSVGAVETELRTLINARRASK